MELKQIKELMAAMERAGMKKMSIKEKDGFELHLERMGEAALPPTVPPQQVFHPVYHPPSEYHHRPPPFTSGQEPSVKKEEKIETTLKCVTSPMVGTLYLAASPEDSPFAKVGDKVSEGTIICIIEAMKVMNEVKAGMSGTIAEICVDNGQPVEFGTKLFRIQ